MRSNVDAYDIVHQMGLGINLGNTMESVNANGTFSKVSDYETYWGAPVTTQKMISGMKKAGFHSIRIPVAWSNMMSTDGNYTINDQYFNRVETIMNYAFNEGMYVIINIHFDGGWWARFGSLKEEERTQAMVKYKTMWKQIANRYKEYSDYLIFESANEELGNRLNSTDDYAGSGYFTNTDDIYKTITSINQAFVDVVRDTGGNNASRFLLIAGYDTSIDQTCDSRYIMPKDTIDCHMMISIHYYSPSTYCISSDPDNDWGYDDSWGTASDIAEMKAALESMRRSYVERGVPVIIGEYGVTNGLNADKTTYHRKEGRDLFLYNVCKYAIEHGMCPVLWDTNEIYSRSSCTVVNETEAANYLDLEKMADTTSVYRPDTQKKEKLSWKGTLGISNWTTTEPSSTMENPDFSVKKSGAVYTLEGVYWSDFKNPVLTIQGKNLSSSINCDFSTKINDSNPYWFKMDSDAVLASKTLKNNDTITIPLNTWGLSQNAPVYMNLSGEKVFSGEITITISEKE